jgi:hypothetical protein
VTLVEMSRSSSVKLSALRLTFADPNSSDKVIQIIIAAFYNGKPNPTVVWSNPAVQGADANGNFVYPPTN